MKDCSKCKEAKELAEFHKNKRSPDGFKAACKSCLKAEYRKYYSKNARAVKKRTSDYKKNNIDATRKYHREYNKRRRDSDPVFKMIYYMRNRMGMILNGTQKCEPQLELLGCSPEYYREYMESQFTDGMTWDNYGEWHQDHIQPCDSFDHNDLEQQRICWHYTNFQPMWAKDNIKKGNKVS